MSTSNDIYTISGELFVKYDNFKESRIKHCFFNQKEMLEWLIDYKSSKNFKVLEIGKSCEGRSISSYEFGNGNTKVMLWSQMHGDEPTATMALADIFKFLDSNQNHIVTKTILDNLHLLVIPMLNPDGAERITRRNAQNIDINRDAIATVTPEAKILKSIHSQFKPEFGFNLHDQGSTYTVGNTKKQTAVALLAPAMDEERSDNNVRLKAKKVATIIAKVLEKYIPHNLAKWDDTFYPNAFGDNIQKWGTSVVLIESGGWPNDTNKNFVRKLNFVSILSSLFAIATNQIESEDIKTYEAIPYNTKYGFDYIIRNAKISFGKNISDIMVDIGINISAKRTTNGDVEQIAVVEDIGDLQNYIAVEKEFNVKGKSVDSNLFQLKNSFALEKIKLLYG